MRKKDYFDPVDLKVDFPETEKKLLDYWDKKGIVKKYLSRNKTSKKYFSFLDGPITANNPMGVHHAWGRTYKDLWQRYRNMRGFKQRFQNGFDAQGLWVEVEVEKELGFKSKKDIEVFGVEKFVNLCKERVKKYSDIQTLQSRRLGYFMDWEHSYFTLSDDNNYMIWHFLKKVHENGWLYKGADSVPWCPRCETAISQHEMLTEDYKEVTHDSVYLTFPIMGRGNEYLLVWTTTPWTIPANIAVAIDTSLEYAKVEVDKKLYWVSADAVSRVFSDVQYKVVKTTKGEKLVGWKYEGAFDGLSKVKAVAKTSSDKFHIVIATDNLLMPITTSEGTGLVHTAVSAGTEDFRLGKKLGLPMIPVIEDDASYMSDLDFLSGLNAKKDPGIILNYLTKISSEGKKFIYKIEKYTHRYPACWRCKTELVWKVTDEWYISMDKPSSGKRIDASDTKEADKKSDDRTLRQRMIDVAEKINWIPGFGLDRELDWLNNMHDWLISKKNRYWGLALPIWECKSCGSFYVIGSEEELKEKTVEGWENFQGKSPHKPQIDGIKIKCLKCGDIISRIEPVGNPWLDAGIVAYSTVSENNLACNFTKTKTKPLYLENKKEWNKWVPADFITESFPGQFKNWFYSLIAMSTVLEDKEPFRTVLGFGTLLGEDGRPMHKSWGNSIEFNEGADRIGVDVMRWMYARQNPSDNLLFGYRIADETRRRFHLKLWNVYNFFVTYSNLDGWAPSKKIQSSKGLSASEEKISMLDKWIYVRFNQMNKLVTEYMEKYDANSASYEIEKFVDDFSLWYIRRSRDRVGPAADSEADKKVFYSVTYFVLVNLSKILAPFTPFLSEMIFRNLTKSDSVHLQKWPDFEIADTIDIELNAKMNAVRVIVEKVHSDRKENGIPVRQPLSELVVFYNEKLPDWAKDLLSRELNVKNVVSLKSEEAVKDKKYKKYIEKGFYLELEISEQLKEEAKARELIRKIQEERKVMGLNLTQKVNVTNDWFPSDNNLVQWIKKKSQIADYGKGPFKVSKSTSEVN